MKQHTDVGTWEPGQLTEQPEYYRKLMGGGSMLLKKNYGRGNFFEKVPKLGLSHKALPSAQDSIIMISHQLSNWTVCGLTKVN